MLSCTGRRLKETSFVYVSPFHRSTNDITIPSNQVCQKMLNQRTRIDSVSNFGVIRLDVDKQDLGIPGSRSKFCQLLTCEGKKGRKPACFQRNRANVQRSSSGKTEIGDSIEADFPRDTLLVHKPQAWETLLAARFAKGLPVWDAQHDYFGCVIPRIGHSTCVDLSANALVTANDFNLGVFGVTAHTRLQAIAEAVRALRQALSHAENRVSVDIVVSIALLSLYRAISGGPNIVNTAHLAGLTAVLTAKPDKILDSEIVQRILDYYCCDASIHASVCGIASPLETLMCAIQDTRSIYATKKHTQLRVLAIQLSIRLPRLVTLARQGESDPYALAQAFSLLVELLPLKDSAAEDVLLHDVTVSKSRLEKGMCGFSFQFKSIGDFEAAISYWHAQMSLLRLCYRLHFIIALSTDSGAFISPLKTKSELQALGKNILMSAEHALMLRNTTRKRLFAHAMVTLWGAANDVPGVFGVEKNALRAGVLSITNAILRTKVTMTESDMNEAAELLRGGPIRGVYAELYGYERSPAD